GRGEEAAQRGVPCASRRRRRKEIGIEGRGEDDRPQGGGKEDSPQGGGTEEGGEEDGRKDVDREDGSREHGDREEDGWSEEDDGEEGRSEVGGREERCARRRRREDGGEIDGPQVRREEDGRVEASGALTWRGHSSSVRDWPAARPRGSSPSGATTSRWSRCGRSGVHRHTRPTASPSWSARTRSRAKIRRTRMVC